MSLQKPIQSFIMESEIVSLNDTRAQLCKVINPILFMWQTVQMRTSMPIAPTCPINQPEHSTQLLNAPWPVYKRQLQHLQLWGLLQRGKHKFIYPNFPFTPQTQITASCPLPLEPRQQKQQDLYFCSKSMSWTANTADQETEWINKSWPMLQAEFWGWIPLLLFLVGFF